MTVKITKPSINVRSELSELRKPSGTAGEAMLRAETPQEQFNLIGAGRRNILINGDMRISQRGDFSSEADAGNDSFQVDRWKLRNSQNSTDVHVNVVTNDLPPVLKNGYALRCERQTDAPSSTIHFGHRQFIEEYAKYAGMTLTYSAWVKSNHPVRLWIFEEGGSSAESESHPGDGQWHLLQVSKVISDNITNLITYLTPYLQHILKTGDYHLSTLHQMEIGKVATPFEHRSYGEELALCQRYCYVMGTPSVSTNDLFAVGTGNGTGTATTYHLHPVEMRARPTLTYSALGDFAVYNFGTSAQLGAPTAISLITTIATKTWSYVDYTRSGTTTGNAIMIRAANTSAKLIFSAEL